MCFVRPWNIGSHASWMPMLVIPTAIEVFIVPLDDSSWIFNSLIETFNSILSQTTSYATTIAPLYFAFMLNNVIVDCFLLPHEIVSLLSEICWGKSYMLTSFILFIVSVVHTSERECEVQCNLTLLVSQHIGDLTMPLFREISISKRDYYYMSLIVTNAFR